MSAATLIVFARAPVPGFCKTRLAKGIGAEAAAKLYEAMLRDTIAGVSAIEGIRKVLYAAADNEGPRVLREFVGPDWAIDTQPDGDLTARLVHAFDRVGPVACIGTDAPTSPFDALGHALHHWSADALMGPTTDGGYWCIGMRRIERALLDGMPWSTDQVASETLKRTQALGLSLQQLPMASDVDEAADLAGLRASLAGDPERAPRTAAVLQGLAA
jgi:rSAM/selenodomain-associated transferase 1